MPDHLLRRIKHFDEQRDSLPGEHWLAFGAGLALWIATRRHPSVAVRVAASLVGTLLVARATTGRDVPPMLARLPFSNRPHRRGDWIG